MDNLILQIIVFAVLFAVGFGFGRHNERKHFKYLAEQEQRLSYIRVHNSRFQTSTQTGQLVHSNVVISHDYFKFVLASIQNFLGGRLYIAKF